MAYLVPSEFVTKMVDAGEAKIFMSTRDTIIRAYMAGAILALAAWFAITIIVQTGVPLIGAILFPVARRHVHGLPAGTCANPPSGLSNRGLPLARACLQVVSRFQGGISSGSLIWPANRDLLRCPSTHS